MSEMDDFVYTPLKVRPAAGQSGREILAPTIKDVNTGANSYIAFSTLDRYNQFVAEVLQAHDPKLEAFFREPEDLIWHPISIFFLVDALDIATLWVDITYDDTIKFRLGEYIDKSYREWTIPRRGGVFRVLRVEDS